MKTEAPHVAGCLYSAAPWASLSGAPICALEQLVALRPFFDGVRLVLCEHGELEERARAADVPVWCSPFAFRGLRQAGLRKFIGGIGAVVRSRWAYVRGLRRLLKEKPGVLHIHSRAAHLPYALLAGRWAGVPVAVTMHEPWEGGWEAYSELWLIRLFADRVVFLTNAMVAQYPKVLKQVDVVYNHCEIPAERNPPANPRLRILMAGRMSQAKGADLFLQICLHLKERGVPFDARMVGPWLADADRAEAGETIARNKLEDEVSIQGTQARMETVYGQADILVHPTRRDSFPRVVMESMCWGIPVVATRVDGIPEMVEDGVTGILVGAGDVEGFAVAAERLSKDPDLRARMGAAGRERAKQLFSPGTYVEAMMGLYRGLRTRDGAGTGKGEGP